MKHVGLSIFAFIRMHRLYHVYKPVGHFATRFEKEEKKKNLVLTITREKQSQRDRERGEIGREIYIMEIARWKQSVHQSVVGHPLFPECSSFSNTLTHMFTPL